MTGQVKFSNFCVDGGKAIRSQFPNTIPTMSVPHSLMSALLFKLGWKSFMLPQKVLAQMKTGSSPNRVH